ncbi:MAG: hypothetical protein HOL07_16595 [Rhodospirillaceae bacterium]|jgi:hypothetical protein|nr:hypothetical protein [Rhodospirillaceae bacterium]MBT3808692.1 hypothetical protein [Rhodospirillaceae bacterium]MBT3932243.1 hypothetical protein [Rhodospirillaceae bacterium]MBT4773380.1 hypothetical protein [Rhodospirillaceae bacterium]MBT5359962.1 hypothetical protein [Rhodospirillaceae bacterium]
MTDTKPDGDVIQEFIRGIARKTIADFVVAATTDDAFISELCAVDLVPDQVAAFAQAKGFSFSADELTAFVEDRIRHEIPADERAFRDRFLAARAAGQTAEAIPTDAETSATLHDVAHTPGYALDRASVLQGDVIALRGVPALPALLATLEDILKTALEVEDLEAVHESLTFAQMKARSEVAYDRLAEDDRVPDLVGAIIDDLGLERELVMWEWPGFRLLFPVEAGGRGVYRAAYSGALPAHRDTWYGSPQHEINLWGPVRRLDADATLRILTRYFRKTVANTSYGYDNWQNYAGVALPPSIRARVNPEGAFAPPLAIGDVMCFSGHQLHASAFNRSGRTRVSFEFRLLHRGDEGAEYVPPNVDYYGAGEIYKGWYDAQGRPVNRLTGKSGTH